MPITLILSCPNSLSCKRLSTLPTDQSAVFFGKGKLYGSTVVLMFEFSITHASSVAWLIHPFFENPCNISFNFDSRSLSPSHIPLLPSSHTLLPQLSL